MSIFSVIQNPFAAAQGAIAGRVAGGRKAQQQAAQQAQAVQDADWLDQQSHSRSLEFMNAQHFNSLVRDDLNARQTRKNMKAGQKFGLNDFSTQTLADGSHSTSFSFKDQPFGQVPTSPLAGANVVGPTQQAAPQAPAAPQAAQAAQAAPAAPAASPAPQAPARPAPAPRSHSGKKTSVSGVAQPMLPGTAAPKPRKTKATP